MRIPEGAVPGPALLRVEMQSSTGRVAIPADIPVILIPEGFRAIPFPEKAETEPEPPRKEF